MKCFLWEILSNKKVHCTILSNSWKGPVHSFSGLCNSVHVWSHHLKLYSEFSFCPGQHAIQNFSTNLCIFLLHITWCGILLTEFWQHFLHDMYFAFGPPGFCNYTKKWQSACSLADIVLLIRRWLCQLGCIDRPISHFRKHGHTVNLLLCRKALDAASKFKAFWPVSQAPFQTVQASKVMMGSKVYRPTYVAQFHFQ
jgi:hypothetical protein